MSNYSNLPWGFAPSTQHIIKKEPPNAHPRRCVVLFICCTSLTIPQSAYADSSLYGWIHFSGSVTVSGDHSVPNPKWASNCSVNALAALNPIFF